MRTLLPLIVAGLLLAPVTMAADHHVDVANGTDQAGCGDDNPSTPADRCKTIRYVIDNVDLNGGDTVRIQPGNYYEDISPGANDAGNASAHLAFVCEDPGNCNMNYSTDARNISGWSQWKQCTGANTAACGGDYPNVWYADIAHDWNGDGSNDQPIGFSEVRGDTAPNMVCGGFIDFATRCLPRNWMPYWENAIADTVAELDCEWEQGYKQQGDRIEAGCVQRFNSSPEACGGPAGTREGAWFASSVANGTWRLYFNPPNDLDGDGTISAYESPLGAGSDPNELDTNGDGINDRHWRVKFASRLKIDAPNDYIRYEGLRFFDANVRHHGGDHTYGLQMIDTHFYGGTWTGDLKNFDTVLDGWKLIDGYSVFNCNPGEPYNHGRLRFRKVLNFTLKNSHIRGSSNLDGIINGSTMAGPIENVIWENGGNHGITIAGVDQEIVFKNCVLGPAQEAFYLNGGCENCREGGGDISTAHIAVINSVIRDGIAIDDIPRPSSAHNDFSIKLYNVALVAGNTKVGSVSRHYTVGASNTSNDSTIRWDWAGVTSGGIGGGYDMKVGNLRASSLFPDCYPTSCKGIETSPVSGSVSFNDAIENLTGDASQRCMQNCTEVPVENMGFSSIIFSRDDAVHNDYHLQAGSPLIDAGIDPSTKGAQYAVTTDMDGNPRAQGAGWDIGPYEFPGAGGGDTTAPAAIGDLAVVAATTDSVTLGWTEVSDDGGSSGSGVVSGYEARRNTVPIDSSNFGSSTVINTSSWSPTAPGSTHQETIGGLVTGTTYYFAVKSRDERSNTAPVSNSPSAITSGDTVPPQDVQNVRRTDTTQP